MEKKRKAFNFLRSYYDVYKMLPNDKAKADFITALCEKQFEGIEPNFDVFDLMAKFAYMSQKHSIEASRQGYEDVLKREGTQGGTQGVSVGGTQGANGGASVQEKEEEEGKEEVQVQDEVKGKLKYPSLEEFLTYGKEKKPLVCVKALTLKFHAWSENDWHKESNGKRVKINNWKTTLLNTLPYIQEGEPEQPKFQRLY